MDTDKKKLLCTFTDNVNYKYVADNIYYFYKIYNACIFVFYNVKNVKEFFLTYNIFDDPTYARKFHSTISIHRKKQYNVLFTIDAMNELIKDENDGIFDENFELNWELYRNSFILKNDFIKIVPIKIFTILKFNKPL